jgi:helix-hairpin-helix protein
MDEGRPLPPVGRQRRPSIVNQVAYQRRGEAKPPQRADAAAFGGADDAAIVARRRAFLLLEGHRESLAARIGRQLRVSRRYEDLCLVKMVTRLQRDYLSQPTQAGAGGDQPFGGGRGPLEYGVADWARPWGPSCLVQLQSDLNDFDDKLKHARRWLHAGTQREAEARAGERFVEIMAKMAGRLKTADFTLPSWASRSSLMSRRPAAPGPEAPPRPVRRRMTRRSAFRSSRRAAPKPVAPGRRVDINEATFEELRAMKLTITQSRRLLAYRKRVKRFESIDELDAIPGFPRTALEQLKHKLSV